MNGPSAGSRFWGGIGMENPTFRQVLGICPTLAVTNNLRGAMTMVATVMFVLITSNLLVSSIRGLLKPHLRIVVFTLVIAAFVTIADRMLAAFMPAMSKELGPYVPLIIVNCIIIARCEIVAARQGLWPSFADAVGQSLGFGLGLGSIATVREILGSGTFFGLQVMPQSWPAWGIMVQAPGAFITLGLLMGAVNWFGRRKKEKGSGAFLPAGEKDS